MIFVARDGKRIKPIAFALRMALGDDDGIDPSLACGNHSSSCILDDEAFLGLEPESFHDLEVPPRIRLHG